MRNLQTMSNSDLLNYLCELDCKVLQARVEGWDPAPWSQQWATVHRECLRRMKDRT